MIREYLANSLIAAGRALGKMSGLEMAVDVSKHDFSVSMRNPSDQDREWDREMFKSGNLFYDGYANPWRPFKPEIEAVSSADQPDEITIEPQPNADPQNPDEGVWVGMKASKTYITTLEQDNYAQLMNPKERWSMLLYGMLGIGALAFLQIIVTLYATGSF